MSNHGGKRTPGKGKKLGRPPKENAKVAGSFRVSAEVESYLREMGTSAEIERLARNSKRFKDWACQVFRGSKVEKVK